MPDHSLSLRVRTAVMGLRARGAIACLVTGRMFRSALPFSLDMSLDAPLVCYQGAMIVDPSSGVTLYHEPLANATALDYVRYAKAHNLHVQLYCDDNYYCEGRNPFSDLYARISGVDPIVVPSLERQFERSPATKAVIIADAAVASSHLVPLREAFESRAYITRSVPEFIEAMNPSVNKGNALSFVAQHLSIPHASTMAIGDSWNDEPFLRAAGFSVAMGSAPKEVRDLADAVVSDSAHDGVAEAIEIYVAA